MKKLLAGVFLALILTGCGAPRPPTELERYKAECVDRGGFLSVIEGPTWSTNAKVGCIEADPPMEDFRP